MSAYQEISKIRDELTARPRSQSVNDMIPCSRKVNARIRFGPCPPLPYLNLGQTFSHLASTFSSNIYRHTSIISTTIVHTSSLTKMAPKRPTKRRGGDDDDGGRPNKKAGKGKKVPTYDTYDEALDGTSSHPSPRRFCLNGK